MLEEALWIEFTVNKYNTLSIWYNHCFLIVKCGALPWMCICYYHKISCFRLFYYDNDNNPLTFYHEWKDHFNQSVIHIDMDFTHQPIFNPYFLWCACKYFDTEYVHYGSILIDNYLNNLSKHQIFIALVLYPTSSVTIGAK